MGAKKGAETGIERIIAIIMRRDELTHKEAASVVNEAREMILEAAASDDYDEAEEIMYSELGLEMDYIFDLLM